MFKLDLEKAEELEINLLSFFGSSKKQENSRKASTSALLNIPKPLAVWITKNCGKFLKEIGTTDPLTYLLRILFKEGISENLEIQIFMLLTLIQI